MWGARPCWTHTTDRCYSQGQCCHFVLADTYILTGRERSSWIWAMIFLIPSPGRHKSNKMSTFCLLFNLNAPQAACLILQVIRDTFYYMYILHNTTAEWKTGKRSHKWKCLEEFCCCRAERLYAEASQGLIWIYGVKFCIYTMDT